MRIKPILDSIVTILRAQLNGKIAAIDSDATTFNDDAILAGQLSPDKSVMDQIIIYPVAEQIVEPTSIGAGGCFAVQHSIGIFIQLGGGIDEQGLALIDNAGVVFEAITAILPYGVSGGDNWTLDGEVDSFSVTSFTYPDGLSGVGVGFMTIQAQKHYEV